ncbi:MAG: hypothetical protein ABI134_35925 [Byssovorax sp.]
MLEAAALCSSLAGFSLLHAAVPARSPLPIRLKNHPFWTAALRLGALPFFALSLALWIAGQGLDVGSVLCAFSWALVGSGFLFAAPVAPRAAWTLALLSPALTLLLFVLRGDHGTP